MLVAQGLSRLTEQPASSPVTRRVGVRGRGGGGAHSAALGLLRLRPVLPPLVRVRVRVRIRVRVSVRVRGYLTLT